MKCFFSNKNVTVTFIKCDTFLEGNSKYLVPIFLVRQAWVRIAIENVKSDLQVTVLLQVPNLFGVCVYSFMCHHSLPSLVTPIRKKRRLTSLLLGDYILILVFYALICLTGIFAFSSIPDLYTLTFEPSLCERCYNPAPVFLQYFLALFPVFTLSTSFPIIGITLRNNLKALCLSDGKTYPFLLDRVLFPLLVIVPPVAVALGTNQIEFLVGITGSYAGTGIQYFIPVALVYCSRKAIAQTFGARAQHSLSSPFRHGAWLVLLITWAVACIVFVTYKNVVDPPKL